jgi:general stress protein 26
VTEVDRVEQINVSFSAPDKQRYVSMSGTAGWVAKTLEFIKAATSDKSADSGENEKLNLK